jgi:PTS system mannitol-specific IIC component
MERKLFFSKSKSIMQRFGNALSKMVMPMILVFIGFGIIATIASYSKLASFGYITSGLLIFVLPLFIAFLGGKLFANVRGGIVGAAFTIGLIIAAFAPTDNPDAC